MFRPATLVLLAASALSIFAAPATPADSIVPLTIQGPDYVTPEGQPVRFWGMNLVASYPEHAKADAFAKNLAALGVNLVRPHHNLRPSKDWNPSMVSGALVTYEDNSREFDPVALDRFDYLNAALRRHGIYLALSVHGTRAYRPGDVDILTTDDEDRRGWMASVEELNRWHWKKGFDVRKLLPVVDERAALLNEEFIRALLTRVNPHTGLRYADDPQVISIEMVNEHALEYAIVCMNRLPDHWQRQFEQRWSDYATAAGLEPGDLYKPATPAHVALRSKFLTELDEAYHLRLQSVIRETGSRAPLTFSNLWRGDSTLEMHQRRVEFMENHAYIDPLVVRGIEDGLTKAGRTALKNKPYFIGELNQAEGGENIARQSPHRTMLPLASAAYGSLHNWSGLIWFAWLHGENVGTGEDGWARFERRSSSLGDMVSDGMMIDHMRTTGLIFRRGLVAQSTEPVTIWTEPPFLAKNYNELMRGKDNHQPGWPNRHAIRRAYGPVPAGQANAPWMSAPAVSPIVSDTGEIVKDVERRQLTVAARQVEAFSGFLDGAAPAGLKHLALAEADFTTVVVVADDENDFANSRRFIVSRTALDAENKETDGLRITLRDLAPAPAGQAWRFTVTRPRPEAGKAPALEISGGSVTLPLGLWHEGELTLQAQ
jgi:hypothetical protein